MDTVHFTPEAAVEVLSAAVQFDETPYLWQSGGGIEVCRVDLDVPSTPRPSWPYVLVSEGEDVTGDAHTPAWAVGLYSDADDESEEGMVLLVYRAEDLASTVARLRTLAVAEAMGRSAWVFGVCAGGALLPDGEYANPVTAAERAVREKDADLRCWAERSRA